MAILILALLVVVGVVAYDRIVTLRSPVTPRLYLPSRTLGWTLRPGLRRTIDLKKGDEVVWKHAISINSYGFNDREWGPKRPGITRVLVMGDSIIEGRQVAREANLVAQAEDRLNADGGKSYELLNIGVAGWSADSGLNFFQQVGRGLEPDLVVHGLFVGNDLLEGDYETFRYLFAYAWDCRRYDKPAFSLVGGKLVRSNFPAWRNMPARLLSVDLYERSRMARRAYQHVNRMMEKTRNGSNVLRAKGVSYNMHMEQTKGLKHFYDQTEAQVCALADECHVAGAKFGVMLEPNFPLFYPLSEADNQSRAYMEYQKDRTHYREMERRLTAKFPVLGLIETLHAAEMAITFRPMDPHLNESGHALVGARLADFIRKLV